MQRASFRLLVSGQVFSVRIYPGTGDLQYTRAHLAAETDQAALRRKQLTEPLPAEQRGRNNWSASASP